MNSFLTSCALLTGLINLLNCLPESLSTITPEQNVPQTCNMCCHGPPGQPGITGSEGLKGDKGDEGYPGKHGPLGQIGPQGPKGNTGSKGDRGQKGVPGNEGLKGDKGDEGYPGKHGPFQQIEPQGPKGNNGSKGDRGKKGEPGSKDLKGSKGREGFPGPQGPRGARGIPGLIGYPGLKGAKGQQGKPGFPGFLGLTGQKGEPGLPATKVEKSAFTAVRTTFVPASESTILFTSMEINVGEDFDNNTGKFTCRISGFYYFMFSFLSNGANTLYVGMNLNGRLITSVQRSESTGHDQLSSGATVQLNVGDEVWLTNEQTVYGHIKYPLTFTGFMIYDMN